MSSKKTPSSSMPKVKMEDLIALYANAEYSLLSSPEREEESDEASRSPRITKRTKSGRFGFIETAWEEKVRQFLDWDLEELDRYGEMLTQRHPKLSDYFAAARPPSSSQPLRIKPQLEPSQQKASSVFPLLLSFVNEEQREETIAVLQHLPELHQDRRQQSLQTAIRFFEEKPEIYNHNSLAFHLLQNAKLRNSFMREVGALTAGEVAALNASEDGAGCGQAWEAAHTIFAVEFQGQKRYPAFQFDVESGQPKPLMAEVLALVQGQWSAWQLALWFVTGNGYLDDATPLEIMESEPERVLETLRKEVVAVEF